MTPPPGYRMLVQLVDAQSEADARQTVWEMYGLREVVGAQSLGAADDGLDGVRPAGVCVGVKNHKRRN